MVKRNPRSEGAASVVRQPDLLSRSRFSRPARPRARHRPRPAPAERSSAERPARPGCRGRAARRGAVAGTGGAMGLGGTAAGGSPGAGGGNGLGGQGPTPTYVTIAGPVIKVDFDMQGRPTSEVTELGYTAWPVVGGTTTITSTFQGVTFTLAQSRHERHRLELRLAEGGGRRAQLRAPGRRRRHRRRRRRRRADPDDDSRLSARHAQLAGLPQSDQQRRQRRAGRHPGQRHGR